MQAEFLQAESASGSPSLAAALRQRRQRLAALISVPVVLWSGQSPSRNFPANTYPFRASSHFLYFAGLNLPNAAIVLQGSHLTLFWDQPTPAEVLWHGPGPTRSQLAEQIGADDARPLADLERYCAGAATIAVQDSATRQQQERLLGRSLAAPKHSEGLDRALAEAIVQVRLCHDELALAEMRRAAQVTQRAHAAGRAATATATTEAEVRAAMEQVILAADMTPAYSSIVTVHGEVLHNCHYGHALEPGELLLADVGAETPLGWAADMTRTWPVSGQFSPTQRDIYDVVQAAHDRCIEAIAPGVEYREIHLLAARVLAEGLVSLGILRGAPDALVEQDAHALFFPHGVGHLLGLDVHDMEDLGDLAGYAPGRTRSDRFGLCYLRLDRPLRPGMVVTVEPGFYQIPALLQDPEKRDRYSAMVNWERLAEFADVRGIRIEDDVLVTPNGRDVLTE
ncbi:aminopeptidase P family protein [Thermoleptolyngbya sp. C42_A2020_037]|uniref:aminopeptidase P family protein n=1 Tax=Thermoleptolyngbya sp. C42_A2020_037 TaxID=2747799 RepID=UPI001A0BBBDA|nr:aminopeptidase P family protein [Thermoleptolyngbya sp. C42_A2020_037]MBF2084989.1 aminopeptidase P family protein [Thermoleptolyngbya sp. C42_A2020_037]